jgi:hypothetical protein
MCIETTGRRVTRGYGADAITVGPRSVYQIRATRLVFEQTWGVKLKPGQVIRHTCDNPPCVNPLHLMVGTQRDNSQDMAQRGRASRWQSLKTHCVHGHEFTEDNTYLPRRGGRKCKTCNRERQRMYNRRC